MMKKALTLRTTLVLGVFLCCARANAQDDLGTLFKSAPDDAAKLVGAYLRPAFKGFGLGLNSGWNNTAKTKNFLGFELRVTATAAFVPTSDRSFDVNTLKLNTIRPVNPDRTTGPTAFGKSETGAELEVRDNSGNVLPNSRFSLPEGTGLHIVPAPQIQLTVGLPKNIDVSLRYLPQTKMGDFGKAGMIGAGAKVELFPLILGKTEKLIPFDMAVAVAISRFTYSKDDLNVGDNPSPNQRIEAKLTGFNVEAIASKKIGFFTPFISAGFNSSKTKLQALGTYEFDTPDGKKNYTNPFTINQTDVDGLRASAGFQLSLAFFRFYASYTAAQYNYANAGIGFSFGK